MPEQPSSHYLDEKDRLVPYDLPAVVKAREAVLVEDEESVLALKDLGVSAATTTWAGTAGWDGHGYAQHFAHMKRVVVVGGNRGELYLVRAAHDLRTIGIQVLALILSDAATLAEWIRKRGKDKAETIKALKALMGTATVQEPYAPAEPPERPPAASEPSTSQDTALPPPVEPSLEEKALRSIDGLLRGTSPYLDRIRRIRQISGDALTAAGPDAAIDLIRWPVVQERVCLEETAYIRRGFPTGMDPLDAITCGLRSGWWVIRGESGMGKSTLVNSWVHASAKEGMPWLIVALEDPWMAWRTMMLARLSNVDGLLIATGNYLTPGSREAVEAHAEAVAEIEAGIYLPKSEAFPMTVRKFIAISEAWCQAIVKKPGGDGGIVLDPPQVLVKAGGEEGLFDRMTELTAHLLSLVDRWRIPVLTTTHLNRQGQELGGTMFEFSAHVRVQVAIGEKAKELNDELPQDEGRFEPYVDVNVTKNKGMPTGRILTRYRKRYARWDVMSAAEEEEPVKALPEPQEGPAPEEEGPPERQFGLYEHDD